MFIKKLYVFLLLAAMTGMQMLSTVHAVEHAIEGHDHNCAVCLVAQENEHASLDAPATSFVSIPDHFSSILDGHFYSPELRVNFFGRAPPPSLPV